MIGLPLSWWGIRWFLEGYTFHTEPGIAIFLVPALFMILIAIVTVSFQAVRAAIVNPVKSLKTE
jgi:putative ABC transport system permease protein